MFTTNKLIRVTFATYRSIRATIYHHPINKGMFATNSTIKLFFNPYLSIRVIVSTNLRSVRVLTIDQLITATIPIC